MEANVINTAPKYRRSRIRGSILDYLNEVNSHPSAEAVYEVMKEHYPRISFGTVYRNLNILVDQGAVKRLESSRGRDRFDARGPSHAHFRCTSCGELFDLDLPVNPESLAESLAAQTGFHVEGHSFEMYGTCLSCMKTQ